MNRSLDHARVRPSTGLSAYCRAAVEMMSEGTEVTVPSDPSPVAVVVNLKGVWNTGRVVIPSMIENGCGGAIVLISSTGALYGTPTSYPGMLAHTAAKHGVIGLMRSWANFLAPQSIRVNSRADHRPHAHGNNGEVSYIIQHAPELANALPVEARPRDVANAVAWLVSDDARYVTASVVPIDAGNVNRC